MPGAPTTMSSYPSPSMSCSPGRRSLPCRRDPQDRSGNRPLVTYSDPSGPITAVRSRPKPLPKKLESRASRDVHVSAASCCCGTRRSSAAWFFSVAPASSPSQAAPVRAPRIQPMPLRATVLPPERPLGLPRCGPGSPKCRSWGRPRCRSWGCPATRGSSRSCRPRTIRLISSLMPRSVLAASTSGSCTGRRSSPCGLRWP